MQLRVAEDYIQQFGNLASIDQHARRARELERHREHDRDGYEGVRPHRGPIRRAAPRSGRSRAPAAAEQSRRAAAVRTVRCAAPPRRDSVMFIVFGWDKTFKQQESLLKSHCHRCSNDVSWRIWHETAVAVAIFRALDTVRYEVSPRVRRVPRFATARFEDLPTGARSPRARRAHEPRAARRSREAHRGSPVRRHDRRPAHLLQTDARAAQRERLTRAAMTEPSAVFKKLNLKDQAEIAVVNAPASFEREIAALRGVAVRRSLAGGSPLAFSLAFVTKQPEVDALAESAAEAHGGRRGRLVRVSEAIVEEVQVRDRPRPRLGRARRGGFRARAHGRDRRGLVCGAVSARRLHQVADARCRAHDLSGRQGESEAARSEAGGEAERQDEIEAQPRTKRPQARAQDQARQVDLARGDELDVLHSDRRGPRIASICSSRLRVLVSAMVAIGSTRGGISRRCGAPRAARRRSRGARGRLRARIAPRRGERRAASTTAASAITNRVWLRTSPDPPLGSMLIFLSDGTLVQDSCWETYRLSRWREDGRGTLRWQEDTAEIEATVVDADRSRAHAPARSRRRAQHRKLRGGDRAVRLPDCRASGPCPARYALRRRSGSFSIA